MKLIFSILFITLTSMSYAQSYQVIKESSSVNWHAEKVTGEHEGTIAVTLGDIWMEEAKLVGGVIAIDMKSILCTDLEGESSEKLVKHLKSSDFFASEEYPTSTITINSAIMQGVDRYKVEAVLTIKDLSKEIKFIAVVKDDGNELHVTADLTIDRTDFDVRYGSGSFFDDLGDKTIYDDFNLKVDLKALKADN